LAKERIGILGGSFNPIHQRHIDIAAAALHPPAGKGAAPSCFAPSGKAEPSGVVAHPVKADSRLHRVIFLPTGNPPHKHHDLAPAEHRFEMTRLAVQGKPGFNASRMELDREGVIYTLDTLRQLRKQYPEAELVYIIGEDTLLDLPNWRQPDQVFALCRFLVCRRPTTGADTGSLLRELEARGARFTFLPLPPVDISATHLRGALAMGLEPADLCPQALEYIRIMGLYGVPPSPPGAGDMYPALRQILTDKRFLHSLLVAGVSRHLARVHGQDENAAALAGLLHDCAKCTPLDELQRIAGQHRLLLDRETLQSQNLLHGPVGAALAESRYHVDDPNILSAISCHTTGKVGMMPLDMILFLADKIEPSRFLYPALTEVRALAEQNLVAAMECMLQSTLRHVTAQKAIPHPSTRQVADWLTRLDTQKSRRSEPYE